MFSCASKIKYIWIKSFKENLKNFQNKSSKIKPRRVSREIPHLPEPVHLFSVLLSFVLALNHFSCVSL